MIKLGEISISRDYDKKIFCVSKNMAIWHESKIFVSKKDAIKQFESWLLKEIFLQIGRK